MSLSRIYDMDEFDHEPNELTLKRLPKNLPQGSPLALSTLTSSNSNSPNKGFQLLDLS